MLESRPPCPPTVLPRSSHGGLGAGPCRRHGGPHVGMRGMGRRILLGCIPIPCFPFFCAILATARGRGLGWGSAGVLACRSVGLNHACMHCARACICACERGLPRAAQGGRAGGLARRYMGLDQLEKAGKLVRCLSQAKSTPHPDNVWALARPWTSWQACAPMPCTCLDTPGIASGIWQALFQAGCF